MELFFITTLTFSINLLIGKFFRLRTLDIVLSFIFHFGLTFLSINYVITNGGDAVFYYNASKLSTEGLNMYFGGNIIVDLVGIFSNYFALSYVNTSLIFSSLGLSGILIYSKIIKDLLYDLPKRYNLIYYLILFSPSLHFWSSLIGKDNLCLFLISLIILSLIKICKNKNYYFLLLLFSLIIIFLVRPHFGLVIIAGISLSTLLMILRKTYFGIMMFILIATVGLYGLNFVINYIQYNYAYVGGISEVLFEISDVFASTEDNTFQINYTPLLSEFRYLIAPFPNFEGGIFSIISAIELIPYFFLFFKPILVSSNIIRNMNLQRIIRSIKTNFLTASFFIIPLMFIIILSATSYNLGVVIRQRAVVSPFYIIPFLIYIRFINGLKPLGFDGFKSI